MLVLTRRNNESLIITAPTGEEIHVILMNAQHGQAQIGVIASSGYNIKRNELLKKEA